MLQARRLLARPVPPGGLCQWVCEGLNNISRSNQLSSIGAVVILARDTQRFRPIKHESMQACLLQARRLLARPVTPVGLWQWVCGGLNVMDAALVLFWLVLQLTWVCASVQRKLPFLRGKTYLPVFLAIFSR